MNFPSQLAGEKRVLIFSASPALALSPTGWVGWKVSCCTSKVKLGLQACQLGNVMEFTRSRDKFERLQRKAQQFAHSTHRQRLCG